MSHAIPRTPRLVLLLVKISTLAAFLALAIGLGGAPEVPRDHSARAAMTSDLPGQVQRMLDRHDCSVAGFGPDRQPESAVVRAADGRLRFVDFGTGWHVFTQHGAAHLVAVCLDAPPAGS